MARNRNLMDAGDTAPRFGKRKAAKAEAALAAAGSSATDRPRSTAVDADKKSIRVGIPTRQPTSTLSKDAGSRVGIPTRQPTSPLKPTGIQRAISMIASRKTPRTKR